MGAGEQRAGRDRLGQLIVDVLGVLVVTSEYSSGTIRLLCLYVLAALGAGGWLLTHRDA
ncbi:hypothetical protein [Streptomyces sp. NPDC056938]|uniref:hypothetical protein n=1 Tax=unclassified Streptomyces TaxID=2593676 RepID=UPI00362D33DC